jgi:hypothetical protein
MTRHLPDRLWIAASHLVGSVEFKDPGRGALIAIIHRSWPDHLVPQDVADQITALAVQVASGVPGAIPANSLRRTPATEIVILQPHIVDRTVDRARPYHVPHRFRPSSKAFTGAVPF